MREMKDSGIEWIGAIPINWDIAQFKKILIRNDGGLWGNDPSGQDDILVLRSTEQTIDGKWDIQSPAYRDLSNVSNVQEYLVKCGDLLITKSSGSDLHIGKTTIVDELIESLHCSFSNFIQRLRVCSKMNPRYYWYILNSNIARGQFVYLQNSTSGIGNINSKNINEIEVPIPPLDIQHTIADYLDRKCSQIDDIIARQQEVIEKLKAYKLSVITEAVTKGLNPDVPMKDSGVEWIGEIPEHWEIRRIGSFARVTSSKRIFEESYVDEGVPFYRSKEITDLSKGLHVQTEIFIPEEVFEQVNEASPAPKCGDILLTSIGTIGNTWISDGRKFYYKDGNITQIEANDSFDSAYVEYCFSSNVVLEQYTRLAMGSTLLALTIIKIKKILVAFPPLDEQRKIVQYLKLKYSSIDAAIKNKENLITKLADYKKSLIYEVVTGKKEV